MIGLGLATPLVARLAHALAGIPRFVTIDGVRLALVTENGAPVRENGRLVYERA